MYSSTYIPVLSPGMGPVWLHRVSCSEGPMLGLVLCSCRLEILKSFVFELAFC